MTIMFQFVSNAYDISNKESSFVVLEISIVKVTLPDVVVPG